MEFIKNKTNIRYRGQKYKVLGTKEMTINNVLVTMIKLPHKKYDLWVNADYVIKC